MKAPIYSPKARADLRSIIRSSSQLFGPEQARRYLDQIEAAGRDLAAGFRKGRAFDEQHPEHLRLRAGSHYLVYRLDGKRRVQILRLLHVRMNIADHL